MVMDDRRTAKTTMSETFPPVPPGSLQQAPGAASPKRIRVRNRVKLPRPTREQQQLAESLLPLLEEAEQHIKQGEPARALEVLQGAAAEPPLYLSPYDQLRWHWLAGQALLATRRFEEARAWLERGLALAERLRPYVLAKQEEHFDALTEWARVFLGNSYFQTGQPGQALLVHRQCLLAITSRALKDQGVQRLVYSALGHDALALGEPQSAIEFFTQARQLADALPNDRQRGLDAWGLGRAYEAAQQYALAQAALEEALHIFEAQGANQPLSAQLHMALGQALILRKDYPQAEHHLQQSFDAAERSGENTLRAAARGALAQLSLAEGNFDQAISMLCAGLGLLPERQDHQTRAQLALALAGAYQGKQEWTAAEQAFREALAWASQAEDNALQIQAHERFAAFLFSQERFQEAFAQEEMARSLQARRAARQ
jgi:tetratricopeptide (TPR) repeat protein